MHRYLTLSLFGIALSGAFPDSASATGGFSCEVNDKSVAFEVSAAMSRGMGGVILEPKGSITLKLKSVPEDMRSFDLSQALVHHWIADRTLKLDYYVERQGNKPFGHVELIIDTKVSGDEGSKGRYRVNIYTTDPPHDKGDGKTQEIRGRVSCFIE